MTEKSQYKQDSVPFRILALTHRGHKAKSNIAYDQVRKALLRHLIEYDYSFAVEDFQRFDDELRLSAWLGADHEWYYTLALNNDNLSAMRSFEAWKKRKPFILDGKRLAVGSRVKWKGEDVTITSMDGDQCIACSYEPKPDPKYANKRKIFHRHTITAEELQKIEKAKRQAAEEVANAEFAGLPMSKRLMQAVRTYRANYRDPFLSYNARDESRYLKLFLRDRLSSKESDSLRLVRFFLDANRPCPEVYPLQPGLTHWALEVGDVVIDWTAHVLAGGVPWPFVWPTSRMRVTATSEDDWENSVMLERAADDDSSSDSLPTAQTEV